MKLLGKNFDTIPSLLLFSKNLIAFLNEWCIIGVDELSRVGVNGRTTVS
jgi:hypothetical protein